MAFDNRCAKNILLGNDCYNCQYMAGVWRLADDKIKCMKNKKVYSMNYVCSKWKQASNESILDRNYYRNKYIEDREFINLMVETDRLLKGRIKVKSEKNT